jgi:hemolysin activation/secretion protein
MFHGVMRVTALALSLLILAPCAAHAAQSPADRADPSVAREQLNQERVTPANARQAPRIEQSAPGSLAAFAPFVVGAVRVEGATMLRPSVFAPAIEPYLGRELGPAELRALATDIANVARRLGYGLASAQIPAQKVVNATLVVTLDEGRIDAVEADGNARANVEHLLRRLVDGRPIRTADLERQLLLAGDVAGVSVDRVRLERRDGRNILLVRTRREALQGRVLVDNWGTGAIGPLRAQFSLDVNGPATGNDRLSIGAVVTPLQPSEFQFVRAAYSAPIGTSGTELALSAYLGHSRPGGALAGQRLEGTSFDLEATASYPLLRSRTASLWANVQLGLHDSDLDRAGATERSDRIATLSAGLNAVGRLGEGWLRSHLRLEQGVDAFGATRRGDPLASRGDGDAVFTKLAFSAQYATPLSARFSLALAMEGQLASRALLATEEMGLGGRSFLRGYDYREMSGDRGVAASAELRFDLGQVADAVRRIQLYAYGDAGKVGNAGTGTGGGSLASAGGGVRIWLRNRLEAGAELGVPLGHSPFHADPKPRFSFTVGYAF